MEGSPLRIAMVSRSSLFTAPGGDTVQMERTAHFLRKLYAYHVEVLPTDRLNAYASFDLLHFFNVIRPADLLIHVKRSGLPYAISPIFVDYGEVARQNGGSLLRLAQKFVGSDGLEYLKVLGRWLKNGEPVRTPSYWPRGHHRSIIRLMEGASILLPNSNSELSRLQRSYPCQFPPYHIVHNGVDAVYLETEPKIQPLRDLICAARFEPLKNQRNLIRAVKGTSWSLTLVGKAAPNHAPYLALCRKEAEGADIRFIDHLSREALSHQMRQHRVHVLPSYFETTGLVSLEAAALGLNVVISDRGDQREYFGEDAHYCQPESVESIRKALQNALTAPAPVALQARIAAEYTWQHAAMQTAAAYQQIMAHHA